MTNPSPLDHQCPTCKAQPGQPCDKRSNLPAGGPNHLTRVDRYIQTTNRQTGTEPRAVVGPLVWCGWG